jgi:hypothetical protein
VGGIDLNQPRMRRVAEAVLALSASPVGFTASELAGQVHSMTGQPESGYGARRAAYDIKKLRAKGMVRKIGKSRRYEPVPEGLRSLTALLVLREKIIRPLLAAGTQPEPQAKPANPVPIDHHYENLPRRNAQPLHRTWHCRVSTIDNLFFIHWRKCLRVE